MMVMRSSSPTFYPANVSSIPSAPSSSSSGGQRRNYDSKQTSSAPPRPPRSQSAPGDSSPLATKVKKSEARPDGQVRDSKQTVEKRTGTEWQGDDNDAGDGIPWSSQGGSEEHVTQVSLHKTSLDLSTDGKVQQHVGQGREIGAVAHYQHRRPRSHFSIPDVVVTSCVEEGEEVHFEVKVEPARRKASLSTLLLEKTNVSGNQPDLEAKKAGGRARPKPPAIKLIDEARVAREARSASESSPVESSPINSVGSPGTLTKAGKRTRKSSFPSLFSKKERDAANAAVALPPSPTSPSYVVHGYGSEASRVKPASPTSSMMTTMTTTSPPQSPTSPIGLASPSFSPFAIVSPNSAPSVTSPVVPSSPSSIRSFSKKEIKAKAKEEKNLIKELEKIDKMVRKHDEKAQKAAKKAKERDGGEADEGEKEGRTKRALKRMSVFRPAGATNKVTVATSATAMPARKVAGDAGQKVSESEDLRARNGLPLLKSVSTSEGAKESDESERSQTAWGANDWADVPSPVEERFPSLTSPAKPLREEAETSAEEKTRPREETPQSLKRNSSATQRARAKMEAERAGRRRSTTQTSITLPPAYTNNSNEASNSAESASTKRRSFLGHSYVLGFDLIEGADMGWEDYPESPVKQSSLVSTAALDTLREGQTTPTARSYRASNNGSSKRATLLESLYKDIEDMESSFQREHSSIKAPASREPSGRPVGKGAMTAAAATATVQPSNRASSSPPSRGRGSEESSWSSGGGTSSKSSLSSPSNMSTSPTGKKVGHNPRGFQFPPAAPSIGRAPATGSPPTHQNRDRAGTLPQEDRRNHDEWIESSLVAKSNSSPQLI